jgi:hypothetical protein
VSDAARVILERTKSDPAMRTAVLALTFLYVAREEENPIKPRPETLEDEADEPGLLRVRAVLDLCRHHQPKVEINDKIEAKLGPKMQQLLKDGPPSEEQLEALAALVKTDLELQDAAIHEGVMTMVQEQIALLGLKPELGKAA